eukprot:1893610-Alexandrium_andersonii.AAC.1
MPPAPATPAQRGAQDGGARAQPRWEPHRASATVERASARCPPARPAAPLPRTPFATAELARTWAGT